ncbi:paraneoplastic antigen Ma6E-like [Pteronotus mesoamericanus]|uniref:paraneoplastic antigen Ma6E-like n=1 Tax=Pteronotus mesoamericanus TaxID=1884717 RepID=UPI0023ED2223|nr:paraneoplastic antigen Ma6E-like [Pteronotus parnellii mesoamericanus]
MDVVGSAGEPGAPGEEGDAGEEEAVGVVGAASEARLADVAGGVAAEEAWIQQWSQALQPVLENMAYQQLRTFSGMEEPGHGDESFESWLDHAHDMLYLWRHVSERERRRRLVESLGGPALDLLCGFLRENPKVTVQDCLAPLVHVFGNKDTEMTVRLKFMTCAQQPQETRFAYVMRLEVLLQAAMEKGAIPPSVADQVRARQVRMWACPKDTLWNMLRTGPERRTPDFLGMLWLIQEVKAWEAAPAINQQFQGEEGGCVHTGDLDAAQLTPAREGAAHAAPARDGEAATAPEDTSQGVLSKEDSAEATPANAVASEAGPGTADPDGAASETGGATTAVPALEETSSATQRGENALAPAGLGQAGPSPARMGSASGVGSRGLGGEPEGQAQAGDQEAQEPREEGLKPIPEELGSEDRAGEMSSPEPSSSK